MTEESYRNLKGVAIGTVLLAMGLVWPHIFALLDELKADSAQVAQSTKNTAASLQIALAHVQAIETDTQRTEAEMAGLLNQTRHSMMTPVETKELVDRAANLMDNANLATIRLGEAADSLRGIAPTMQGAIQQVAADSHNTMAASQALMTVATGDLNDPAIKASIGNVETISEETATTATNIAATTTDVKDYVHRATRPVRGTWNILEWLLTEAWKARGALGM